ncbi:MAG: helix-turn-helix domain-containing protein [Blastocatellia bacterium]
MCLKGYLTDIGNQALSFMAPNRDRAIFAGMMRLRVREIAEALGIRNAAQLRTLTGLGMGSCYQLWDDSTKMVSIRTLNTLCNKLNVHPALLFEYSPDAQTSNSGKTITSVQSTKLGRPRKKNR